MSILLKLLSSLKSGWSFVKGLKAKTIFVGVSMAVVAFALCSRQVAIKKYDALKNEVAQAKLKQDIQKAKTDTLWIKREIIVIDTLWRDRIRIDTTGGVIDTFSVPCPEERGYIGFDTTCQYGSDKNVLSVAVEGRAYYPASNPNRSWLRIVPDLSGLKLQGTTISHRYAIGLGIMNNLSADEFSATLIGYMRFSRLSLMAGYNSKKIWSIGFGYDFIAFGK